MNKETEKKFKNALTKIVKEGQQNIKDVEAGKKMFCNEAFQKFRYEICDLLSVPPDACLTEEQWKKVIDQAKRLFNR